MTSFVVVLVGLGLFLSGGGGLIGMFLHYFYVKSAMSMFCNVITLLLLYVHVYVTRTDWKTRPRPKTIILSIKKSNQIKSNQISLFLSHTFLCTVIWFEREKKSLKSLEHSSDLLRLRQQTRKRNGEF